MLGDSGEESLSAITDSLTVTDVKPVFNKWAWQEIASQNFFWYGGGEGRLLRGDTHEEGREPPLPRVLGGPQRGPGQSREVSKDVTTRPTSAARMHGIPPLLRLYL